MSLLTTMVAARASGSHLSAPAARTIAVLGEALDSAAWTLLSHAATQAGCTILHLGSGAADDDAAPVVIIAGLPAGRRRLPARVSELAQTLFPTVPVLLLCHEALAQPAVELAGGRIVLVPAAIAPEVLADHLRRMIAQPGLTRTSFSNPAQPGEHDSSAALAARIHHWQGETWSAFQVDGQPEAVIARPDGVLAVHAVEAAARIAGDLERIADACADLRTAERLIPGHLHPGSVAMVRLIGDAWLLARQGAIAPVLMSRQRLPSVWTMTAHMRWIAAKPGDVVVVASQLPDGVAPGMSGDALAQTLAAAAIPALIIERRR